MTTAAYIKLSEYIKHLQRIQAEHGDLPVTSYNYSGVGGAYPPTVRYMLILNPKQHTSRYWTDEEPERRGEKVVST